LIFDLLIITVKIAWFSQILIGKSKYTHKILLIRGLSNKICYLIKELIILYQLLLLLGKSKNQYLGVMIKETPPPVSFDKFSLNNESFRNESNSGNLLHGTE